MPPSTRSRTAREAVSTSTGPAQSVLANDSILHQRLHTSNRESKPITGRSSTPDEPPRFIIDLSLPPEKRYLEVCEAFKERIQNLVPLYEEVVGGASRVISLKWLRRLSRVFLRRVYDDQENRELKGISAATGVEMYLLVCFNVLLDLFMGCSSGGAAVRDGKRGTKMVHFRTLDWGMPALRKIVVQLDFVTEPSGPVVASSITYAGYVGVLTGVRKDFSVSLNFRPNRHGKGEFWSDTRYYWHLLMVLLGRRRSISSQLRQFLLPGYGRVRRGLMRPSKPKWYTLPYSRVLANLDGKYRRPMTSTVCYLCFSDGRETTVIEKDRASSVVRSSNEFIAITNNDVDHEDEEQTSKPEGSLFAEALEVIVEEAKDRRQCAEHNYHNLRAKEAQHVAKTKSGKQPINAPKLDDIVELVQKYPTTNEQTHFACVMDPKEGVVNWCRRWTRPVTAKWIREHQSDTW